MLVFQPFSFKHSLRIHINILHSSANVQFTVSQRQYSTGRQLVLQINKMFSAKTGLPEAVMHLTHFMTTLLKAITGQFFTG